MQPSSDRPQKASLVDPESGIERATHTGEDAKGEQPSEYPTGVKLALIMTSVYLTMFLTSLDRLITATALPAISDEFHNVTDIGWYGSGYLLTTCTFQLLFGKIYTFFSIKYTLLTSVAIFEVGSVISGAAPSSDVFIVGRALAGLGAAGVTSGIMMVIVVSVPLHKRAMYQGIFGAVFGVSSIAGPLLGGVFTSDVTWRWCFYINLPIGGVVMGVLFLVLKTPQSLGANLPLKDKLLQIDSVGTFLIVPACVCLILALQWGGSTYAWSNGRVVALLVVSALLFLGFAAVQALRPKTATIPTRVLKRRSILAAVLSIICVGSHMMVFAYYVPIWFQGVKGYSAIGSGIRTLPMMLAIVFSTLASGALVRRIGYYTPFLLGGVVFSCVGAGLMTTFTVDTSEGKWVGYQILYGVGLGLSTQVPNLAAQTVLEKKDVAIGTSLMFFAQTLGGTIFLSVAQSVLSNQLLGRLAKIPGVDPSIIEKNGVTALRRLPADVRPAALMAYNDSIVWVLRIGLILACVSIFGALAMEWRSMKEVRPQPGAEEPTKNEKGVQRQDSEDSAGL